MYIYDNEEIEEKQIARLLVGVSGENSDLRYVSRFLAPDTFILLDKAGEIFVLLSSLEIGRGRKVFEGRAVVLSYDDIGIDGTTGADTATLVKALLVWTKVDHVVVQRTFPYALGMQLQESGITVDSIASTLLYPQRQIKTEEEISHLKSSQRAAARATELVAGMLADSSINGDRQLVLGGEMLTSERIRLEIDRLLLQYDCTAPDGNIVACGDDAADPHQPGTGPLVAGSPIVVDIFPRHRLHGYWGDITRTFIKGNAEESLRHLVETVREVQQMALEWVASGASGTFIHHQITAAFEIRGYPTTVTGRQPTGFIHSTGHGVGLDIHEFPRISRIDILLKAGHVVTIEPGLYYPGIGGARFEDTVVVRENGYEFLCPCDVPWLIP
ncbi:MAG: aminopeptidase P family protein [Spartobacteria bacterium]|nr:aminopeptidase P family protein [Spartobacteria bacterium]